MERIRVKVNGENIGNEISYKHGIDVKTIQRLKVKFYNPDNIPLLSENKLYNISIGDNQFSEKWILERIRIDVTYELWVYSYEFIPSGVKLKNI